jgi:2-dehydro-3-deoxyphosphooctonate aldolase (KDO 8-P synthase)
MNIQIPGLEAIGNGHPFFVIAGPCVIESRSFAIETAHALDEMFRAAGVRWVYKSSFDKANRSSSSSFRGPGMDSGLDILSEVRERFGIPVLTDVHETEQVEPVARAVDILQTPAFLCRQTDFIMAVASTGKPVNIKKGQFLSPHEMESVLKKALSTGNDRIMLCERGFAFGYNNLVVDMRSLPIMARTGHPVIFDATHSVQMPGAANGSSGGDRTFVPYLSRAAIAAGVAGLFIEAHPDPDRAPCDGPNMVRFSDLPKLIDEWSAIDNIVKGSGVRGEGQDRC